MTLADFAPTVERRPDGAVVVRVRDALPAPAE